MKRIYSLYKVSELKNWGIYTEKGPARHLRYFSLLNDFRLAWLVFTRKADAFIWPEVEEQNK